MKTLVILFYLVGIMYYGAQLAQQVHKTFLPTLDKSIGKNNIWRDIEPM